MGREQGTQYLSSQDRELQGTFHWDRRRRRNYRLGTDHRSVPLLPLLLPTDEKVVDTRNLPILIHDNKGRLLPSILGSLLRLLNHWSFTSALAEYRSFLPDEKAWIEGQAGKPERGRERLADLEVSREIR